MADDVMLFYSNHHIKEYYESTDSMSHTVHSLFW